MSRIIAVVEGRTEMGFIRQVLGPWLGAHGVFLTARLVGKPGHKGGVGEYPRARKDILNLLRQDSQVRVTTQFDFYAMPGSWPGREAAAERRTVREKAEIVEQSLAEDIARSMGADFQQQRFIPYVQMHEFESLLFASPAEVCQVLGDSTKQQVMSALKSQFSTPEEINDHPATAPSRRLLSLFAHYRKALHGPIVAGRIGIQTLLKSCPHFAAWVHLLMAGSPRELHAGGFC